MALPLEKKILLDTNVFIDYLRLGLHAEWVFGAAPGKLIRFVSAVVMMELRLGADTRRREKAVNRLLAAFPASRVIAPSSLLFVHAARLFRTLYGDGSGLRDRLGPVNDLLIALTARQIGAAVVTSNLRDFRLIADKLPGLRLVSPQHPDMGS